MKKQTPKKKDTVLSVLLRIEEYLKALAHKPIVNQLTTEPETIVKQIIVDFPAKTMREIYEETDNKIDTGKLLYNIEWYKNEYFFTTDRCRTGKRVVNLELVHMGKSWNETDVLRGEDEFLSPAEVTYLLAYVPEYRELLKNYRYTWTSGRASGGDLVRVGSFDGGGVAVLSSAPGDSYGRLGSSFSRRT